MRKSYFFRIPMLIWGLFLYSLGAVVIINAQIGYAPWDVFHAGFSKVTGASIGTVSIVTGITVGVLVFLLGEKLGLGTIANMVLIGSFLDMIIALRIVPITVSLLMSIIMLTIGLIIMALATYFYINAGFGAGPRDSLMVALTRMTHLPIGVCRGGIEVLVVFIGWRLGGMVGIGTLISAMTIGLWIQTVFRLFRFDATKIKHETLNDTYRNIFVRKYTD